MTLTDTLEQEKVEDINARPDLEGPSDADKETVTISESETGVIEEAIMPEIKGLEILKEGTYAVDLEKTITQMYSVIKNMETQLQKVMGINTDLEKDLDAAKEMVAELKLSNTQLEETIARMEEEMPTQKELQVEIDHLIDERNDAQYRIHEMKLKLERMEEIAVRYQDRIAGLEEEKRDAVAEINFLESQLNSVVERNGKYEKEINVLRGEKLAHIEKMKSQKEELNEALEEKYLLFKELKQVKEELKESRSALAREKLRAR